MAVASLSLSLSLYIYIYKKENNEFTMMNPKEQRSSGYSKRDKELSAE